MFGECPDPLDIYIYIYIYIYSIKENKIISSHRLYPIYWPGACLTFLAYIALIAWGDEWLKGIVGGGGMATYEKYALTS
jgi:hypothetical protein